MCFSLVLVLFFLLLFFHPLSSLLLLSAAAGGVQGWSSSTAGVTASSKNYMAKVAEVLSGDSIILSLPEGSERRVYLASIRCPRPGNLVRQNSKEEESMAMECKEFVRRKIIGKHVKVRRRKTGSKERERERVEEMVERQRGRDVYLGISLSRLLGLLLALLHGNLVTRVYTYT